MVAANTENVKKDCTILASLEICKLVVIKKITLHGCLIWCTYVPTLISLFLYKHVRMCACVRVCVCVRACVRACVLSVHTISKYFYFIFVYRYYESFIINVEV